MMIHVQVHVVGGYERDVTLCVCLQVHVNIMLLEARLQAELLYSLRALMQHMT